jgi:AcrR family transcriptional regulator
MSPRAHTASEQEAGGVRERILKAAMAILREEGIQGLSQVQVARNAKVRQSHLTYYFPKRCDLLEAVAVRFVDGVVRGIGEIAARSAPGDAVAMLRRIADAITDRGHMRMFTGVIAEADSDPEVRTVVLRETRRVQSAVAEVLGGEGAMERAALVLASLWGLGLYDFVFQLPTHRSAIMRSLLTWLGEVTSRPQEEREGRGQDDARHRRRR